MSREVPVRRPGRPQTPRARRVAVLCARLRIPLTATGVLMLLLAVVTGVPALSWPGLGLTVVGLALYLRVGTVRDEPRAIASPVHGRWLAMNSPATRVPSHGLHGWGQTYAIDVVHEPADDVRPSFSWWPPARRPQEFPAFGQPVTAPADGVVVVAHDRRRDHWSRTSWPSLPYLLVEGALRELLGARAILGNHVVLDVGDGAHVLVAHLRRGSARVRVGDRVAAGEPLGECGNSGNSSEPHVHLQLMDHPRAAVAAGLAFTFTDVALSDGGRGGVPANGQHFAVDAGIRS